MRKSTIKLTKHELNFATATSYPLAKHQVVQKVSQLFQHLGQKLIHDLDNHELTGSAEYKITKGENYRLMPYLVLDFPRITGKDFPLTCRTMFWWGHYFSCNLIIQTALLDPDKTAGMIAGSKKIRLLTGDDLWEQDLNTQAYSKLSKLSAEEIRSVILQRKYLKLTVKINLSDYDTLEEKATRVYQTMLTRICIKKGA